MKYILSIPNTKFAENFETYASAYAAGKAMNTSFKIFKEVDGLTEADPVLEYNLPTNSDSDKQFLTE